MKGPVARPCLYPPPLPHATLGVMPRTSRSSVNTLLLQLRSIRHTYTPEHRTAKAAILHAVGTAHLGSIDLVTRWQDDLLFLLAFPDDALMREIASALLRKVERLVKRLPAADRAAADDTGIAGSKSRHVFAWPIARWLVSAHPRDVDFDWPSMTDTAHLDRLIRSVVQRAEDDAFESGEWSVREWIALARGSHHATDLAWLVSRGAASVSTARMFGAMYDAAGVQVRWTLAGSRAAVSSNLLSTVRLHARTSMRPPPTSPVRHITRPLSAIARLGPERVREVIDVARAALAVRCREVEAVSLANPDDVWLADLGEGTQLAIIGTLPQHRLSLESNYGYLLLSNGVPIGYGGVTPLFQQANTGINIFDPFRHSEAAFVWAQMLRAFHALFGVKRFVVNAYQFGEGNDEAISSGAFWFYYRLGFRPVNADVRRLAAKEQARRAANKSHHSTSAALKQLASGDMHLTLSGFKRGEFFDEQWLPVIAGGAAQLIAAEDAASSDVAVARIARRVAEVLGARTATWTMAERAAFTRLAPVVAQLPALQQWPVRERRALAALIRAKGAPQEHDFVRMSHAHPRFYQELIALAQRRTSTARTTPV